ncbi:MAG: hypothetical protein RJA81_575, partial [Planctomycetota bacterium]
MTHDDLRDVLRGELFSEPVSLSAYCNDSSIWEQIPLATVCPSDEDDLLATIAYGSEQKIPLHPRGSGLGVTGESLGSGIVLDLSRNFRRILRIGSSTVTVQAGVTMAELNHALLPTGRRVVGSVTDQEQMTVGGWLSGNDSRHGRLPQFNSFVHPVVSLRMALANGQ